MRPGRLRVFPRGARFDAPLRFQAETGTLGDEPAGLDIRRGGSTQVAELDRAVAAAELLRVRAPDEWSPFAGVGDADGRRSYREARLEPGDAVTIIGRAIPFSELSDPAGADIANGSGDGPDDPEVAADLAAARAAGTLADDPARAWGNAAIPGFGIGRPVAEPEIDPAADRLPLASPDEAARAARTFEIAPETLVLAAVDEVPLLIAYGEPAAIAERDQTRLLVGLFGALLAIGSALVMAAEPQRRSAHVSPFEAAATFAVAVVLVVLGFIVVASYNAVVALRQRIDKAWANIDVVLKQRHDQLPNLVAAVRGLMAYERDVLTRVTEARAAYAPTAPIPDQAATSEATSAAVRSLFAVVERYPDVKARHQRPGPPGRDRTAGGDDRGPARALQRPGLPLQHPDLAVPGRDAGAGLRLAVARILRRRTRSDGGPGHGPRVGLTVADPSRAVPPTDAHHELWLVRHGETEWAGWAGTPGGPTFH